MSREACIAQVANAEARVKQLKMKALEKAFTVAYFIFAGACVATYLIRWLLIGLGVIDTIASPLVTVGLMLLLLVFGFLVGLRAVHRHMAKLTFLKAQQNLARFKHVKPAPYSGFNSGSGGFSNYRKNTTVLTNRQLAADRKKEATVAAETKVEAKATAEKSSPLKTNMRRGSGR